MQTGSELALVCSQLPQFSPQVLLGGMISHVPLDESRIHPLGQDVHILGWLSRQVIHGDSQVTQVLFWVLKKSPE